MGNRRTLGQVRETERFCDLESWIELFGFCMSCGRVSQIDRYHLERKYGKQTVVQSLKGNLKCVVCKNSKMNMIGARNKLRD